jgi:phosphatidyl-myo-inositol dimannoside synthase
MSKRVLLLSSEFPPGPGGIGVHNYHVAYHLNRLGMDVAVVTKQDFAGTQEIAEFNQKQPFPITSFQAQNSAFRQILHRWQVIMRSMSEWKPDIVLVGGAKMVWLASAIMSIRRIPWVSIGYGTEFGYQSQLHHRLTQFAFACSTATVCITNYTHRYMLERGFRPRQTHVIHPGADSTRFKVLPPEQCNAFRKEQGLEQAKVLVTVGHVAYRKGQDIVIRALPAVLDRFPDTHYVIIGLPTNQAEFSTLAAELGIQDHVRFLGKVSSEQLLLYLNICDVFVMTSRHHKGEFEGFGIAAVEAALCGKPSVVSANSGLVEAVDDGKTGIVVPENDPAATAKAIIALFENETQRKTMGQAALKRAISAQTWEICGAKYHEYLSKIIAQNER